LYGTFCEGYKEEILQKLLESLFNREKTEIQKFLKDNNPDPKFWNEVLADVK